MDTAIEDVEHGYRQSAGRRAAKVAKHGQVAGVRRRPRYGQAHPKDGIGAEFLLVRTAVQCQHGPIHRPLIQCIHILDHGRDIFIDVLDRVSHAFAAVATWIVVAQFHRFMHTRGGTGRHCRAPIGATGQGHIDLHGRIAAGVENFPGANGSNVGLHVCLQRQMFKGSAAPRGSAPIAAKRCGYSPASAPPARCDPRIVSPAWTPIPATAGGTTTCRDDPARSSRPGNGRRGR